jgi:hypothetical protein
MWEATMTAFDDLRVEFTDWCKEQRDSLQRQRDLFSNGTCKMHRNGEDITAETLASIVENIAELDRLIAKCEDASR